MTSPVVARADCTCRAPGIDVAEGETVCLKTASGPQLARCEKVLNNTSWTFLGTPCPSANLNLPRMAVSSLANVESADFVLLR